MIRGAIDSLGAAGSSLFLRYAGYLLALAVVKGIFQYWMRVILIGISRDIEYDMRNQLFRPSDHACARLLRAHAHRRHHGARHERS